MGLLVSKQPCANVNLRLCKVLCNGVPFGVGVISPYCICIMRKTTEKRERAYQGRK